MESFLLVKDNGRTASTPERLANAEDFRLPL